MKHASLQFILDGEVMSLDDSFDPQMSVLNYCRETLQRTGTHEGCAEGDCGACTVVIAELSERSETGVVYRSVNACILLLPMLQGKALFTVESLTKQHDLHPVQQAMVAHHASQCGFCTPGFVMSLFWLYQHKTKPSRDQIDHVLSGNLCRCTGYRPIVDAALHMHEFSAKNTLQPATKAIKKQLLSIQQTEQAVFETDHGTALLPHTTDQLSTLKKQHPNATIIAGNSDVGLWINKHLKDVSPLLFIGQIAALKQIDDDGQTLKIYAGVALHDAFIKIVAHFPSLAILTRRFASMPVCQSGTLVGNIANGSPIGDSMPVLIALGASITLRHVGGSRSIALDDFYLGYQQKDLAPEEWIESVSIPFTKPTHLASYKVSKRFDQDISAVCLAVCLQLDAQGQVAHCRIVCGGMAATPKRAHKAEQALLGKTWNNIDLAAAQAAIIEDYQPLSDLRSSAAYRLKVVANLLQRFYAETTQSRIAVLGDLT